MSTFTDLQHARKHVMIFIHLLAFAMIWLSFPAKTVFNLQLALDSFLDENSQVCSFRYLGLFILLGHLQQTTFFESRRWNEKPEALCFPRHLYTSPGFASCIKLVQSLLQPCRPASSLAEDLSLTVHCTISSITGP